MKAATLFLALALALSVTVAAQERDLSAPDLDAAALSSLVDLPDSGNLVLMRGTVRDVVEEHVFKVGLESQFEAHRTVLTLAIGDPAIGRFVSLDCGAERETCLALAVGDDVLVTATMVGFRAANARLTVGSIALLGE